MRVIPTLSRGGSGASVARVSVLSVLGVLVLVLAGCQADYSADVTNKTPQPLFVQVFSKGNNEASLGASRRLGPGDRALIGPVRNQKNLGAFLSVDTLPNPGKPITLDLAPGANFFDVRQDSDTTAGPLVVIPK